MSKEVLLGACHRTIAKLRIKIKGKSKDKGKWFTILGMWVLSIFGIDGMLEVDLKEV